MQLKLSQKKRLTSKDLYIYQKQAINKAYNKEKTAIFIDMGCGKTAIGLGLIKWIMIDKRDAKILIIAPQKVINNVWITEAYKWEFSKDIFITPLQGNIEKRIKLIENCQNIYAINPDLIRWFANLKNTKKITQWDLIIIDESSMFKNEKSKRFKAIKKLKYHRILLLTGTPMSNGYEDLWSQIFLLDFGLRLETTKKKYLDIYFERKKGTFKYTLKEYKDEEIIKKVKDITYRIENKKMSKQFNTEYIDKYISMDNETIKLYNEICMTYQDNVNEILEKYNINYDKYLKSFKKINKQLEISYQDKMEIMQASISTNNFLRQICNGFLYISDKETNIRKTIQVNENKIDILDTIIKYNKNENIIIAYYYKEDLIRLKKKYPYAKQLSLSTNRNNIVNEWNENKIKILLAHPKSCGHGLNLQFGGHIIIWYGFDYSLELYNQMNARIIRNGQTKNVLIYHILNENKIDQYILEKIRNKDKTQFIFLALLNQILDTKKFVF